MLNLSAANLAAIASEVPWPVDLVTIKLDHQDESKIVRITNHYHNLAAEDTTIVEAGNWVVGRTYQIASEGSTDWLVAGGDTNLTVGDTFEALTVGAGSGTAFLTDSQYLAAGEFLGFTEITDSLEVKDNSLDLQLSGVAASFTAVMLGESVEGALVSVKRGYYDESAGALVDEPFLRWAGRVNNFAIQDDYNFTEEDAIAITVSCKSLLSTMLSKQAGRFTSPQGFEKFNSGDKSMEFVPSLSTFNPKFGKE